MAASKQRKKVNESLEKLATRAMRELTFRAWQTLTLATPVATGFARAGWVPTTGVAEPGPSSSLASKAKGLTGEARGKLATSQAKALAKKGSNLAKQLARGYTLKQGATFIANGVRYVIYLNRGSSAQAPKMFIETALKQAIAATKRALAK